MHFLPILLLFLSFHVCLFLAGALKWWAKCVWTVFRWTTKRSALRALFSPHYRYRTLSLNYSRLNDFSRAGFRLFSSHSCIVAFTHFLPHSLIHSFTPSLIHSLFPVNSFVVFAPSFLRFSTRLTRFPLPVWSLFMASV